MRLLGVARGPSQIRVEIVYTRRSRGRRGALLHSEMPPRVIEGHRVTTFFYAAILRTAVDAVDSD